MLVDGEIYTEEKLSSDDFPEGNELTTSAGTDYQGLGPLQWSVSMLVSAQVTGIYQCSLQVRASEAAAARATP